MEFGICFKGFVQPNRARYLVRQAEEAGFTYCWFYDSHILWRESFMAIAMCMEHTKTMRFGPCVTNPNTRDWSVAASMFASLAHQSGGRFDIGLGRGDSAVRVMGQKPAPLPDANCSFAFSLGQLALIKNLILFSLFVVIVEKTCSTISHIRN